MQCQSTSANALNDAGLAATALNSRFFSRSGLAVHVDEPAGFPPALGRRAAASVLRCDLPVAAVTFRRTGLFIAPEDLLAPEGRGCSYAHDAWSWNISTSSLDVPRPCDTEQIASDYAAQVVAAAARACEDAVATYRLALSNATEARRVASLVYASEAVAREDKRCAGLEHYPAWLYRTVMQSMSQRTMPALARKRCCQRDWQKTWSAQHALASSGDPCLRALGTGFNEVHLQLELASVDAVFYIAFEGEAGNMSAHGGSSSKPSWAQQTIGSGGWW
eukprot:3017106-Prymnesium_polylepis.2